MTFPFSNSLMSPFAGNDDWILFGLELDLNLKGLEHISDEFWI